MEGMRYAVMIVARLNDGQRLEEDESSIWAG
jgi:hypothetical protein